MGYRQTALNRISNGTNTTEMVRLKVAGPQNDSRWLLITKDELDAIAKLLAKGDD